jgi:hypothetical protein
MLIFEKKIHESIKHFSHNVRKNDKRSRYSFGYIIILKITAQVLQSSMNLWIVEMYEWFYDTTCAVAFIACFGTLFYISIVY